jgi:hypothetical protein
MNQSNRFKIHFGELAAGWLLVTLENHEQEYCFNPSHVPYDSIQELVDGLGNLLSGNTDAKVRWNDEPVEHEFRFTKKSDEFEFLVIRFNGTQRDQPEKVFTTQGTAYSIMRTFWMALRDLETRYSLDEYRERWREPFPVREMSFFTNQFQKLKAAQAQIIEAE